MSRNEDFTELFLNSHDEFIEELTKELKYYKRTKIISFLDLYRIRKRVLPMLDVWISSRDKSYATVLNIPEDLLLQAIREEENLCDLKEMVNENKYILRNAVKLFLSTLPNDIN